MCGFKAQLAEHRTVIVEVTGSNLVEALLFFRLLLSNCLNWEIYCDDHSSLSLFYYNAYIVIILNNSKEGQTAVYTVDVLENKLENSPKKICALIS